MSHFVCNDISDAARLVNLVAEKDDRTALHDAGQSLKGWRWQYVDGHDRNATTPQVSEKIIEFHALPALTNLVAPGERIGRHDRWRMVSGSEGPNDSTRDLKRGMNRRPETVTINVSDAPELSPVVGRGGEFY
jgi:hypothetical protein